jgi:Bacterial Ig-like domain
MYCTPSRWVRLWIRVAVVLITVGGLGFLSLGSTSSALAASDTGYRDFYYSASSVNSSDGVVGPTADKPQSKLWFNDGIWWGSLFNRATEEYRIYRYDWSTHTWSDTGTLIDARNSARADTKWDGRYLYVATASYNSTTTDQNVYVKRYSYNPATKTYTLDSTATVATGPIEAVVLDKDTTGKLWVTYTKGNQVYVNRSLGSDSSWGTPFVPPVKGTSVNSDDISAVIAFDSQIGVMWSNQTDSAVYFATHNDADADNVWQVSRTAIQGPNYADDHINLKSLQADSSGGVYAAVKTSLNDLPNPNPNAPLTMVLKRDQAGNWTNSVFGRVADNHTRPILMIDEEHRNLYMFATAPCCTGGTIYYKQTSLDNISFPQGVGTPFIQSSTDTHINNATSTKQNGNSTTGLVVMASDTTSNYYWHNRLDLSNPPTVTSVAPADGATDVAATANVEATFSKDMDTSTLTTSTFMLTKQGSSTPVGAAVNYDATTKKATLDPQEDLSADTTYTATVKGGTSGAKDSAGYPLASDKTWSFRTAAPADTTPPDTTIESGPSGTVSSTSASFVFSSSETGSSFECSLDGASYASCTSPEEYTNLADGSHTFYVKATDAAGNTGTAATQAWTVDTTRPTVSSVAPADGATDVAATANVEATFSKDMDTSTLTTSTFTLTKQGSSTPVTAAVSYDSATKKATLNPNADLAANITYTATVKGGASGAKDAAGNPLASDKTWSLTTQAPAQSNHVLVAAGDAAILENAKNTNYGKNVTLGVDGDEPAGTTKDKSALLKWDLSGIAPGTKVNSASVTLTVSNSSTQTYQVYKLKRPWVELKATWVNYDTSKPWQVAGANGTLDRDATAVGTIKPTTTGKQTITITPSVVQGWVDNPSSNQGIVIANTTNTDGFDFYSRESTTSSQRPTLTLDLGGS